MDSKNVIQHHGILGMKWGKRNGPPYPLSGSQKSYAEKSAAKKSGGSSGSTRQEQVSEYFRQKNHDAKQQNGATYNYIFQERQLTKRELRAKEKADKLRAKKNAKERKKSLEKLKRTNLRGLTYQELKELKERLDMEVAVKEDINFLLYGDKRGITQKGKKLAENILNDSTQNIATQALTHLMGDGLNKVAGIMSPYYQSHNYVNPYKGQGGGDDKKKDKN